jgi:transposase InsO family protein
LTWREGADLAGRVKRSPHAGAATARRRIHHSDQGKQYTSIVFRVRCDLNLERPTLIEIEKPSDT